MDTLSTETLIVSIGVLILLSAYFSSSETALISVNRYRLRHLVTKKHRSATKVSQMLRRPDRMLGVILIGNNLVNILAASLATLLGLRLLGEWGPLTSTIVLTLIFLIFAEVTPKTVAAFFPERVAFASVHLLAPLLKLFYPAVVAVNAISNKLAGLFGVRPEQGQRLVNESLSTEELRTLVDEDSALDGKGADIMLGVLDIKNIKVDDVMVPKADVVSLDMEKPLSAIVHQICTTRHTSLPVIRGGFDNVLGTLTLRRVYSFLTAENKTKEALLEAVEPAHFIPEGTPLLTQLMNFQETQSRIGLVVDEYGDLQGIITISDILAEIVGEFTGQRTRLIAGIQPSSDGSYLINGAMPLRQINRMLGWNLPLDGPKTLNGLIIQHLDMFPEGNTCIRLNEYRFETTQIADDMIRMARVSRMPSDEEADSSLPE